MQQLLQQRTGEQINLSLNCWGLLEVVYWSLLTVWIIVTPSNYWLKQFLDSVCGALKEISVVFIISYYFYILGLFLLYTGNIWSHAVMNCVLCLSGVIWVYSLAQFSFEPFVFFCSSQSLYHHSLLPSVSLLSVFPVSVPLTPVPTHQSTQVPPLHQSPLPFISSLCSTTHRFNIMHVTCCLGSPCGFSLRFFLKSCGHFSSLFCQLNKYVYFLKVLLFRVYVGSSSTDKSIPCHLSWHHYKLIDILDLLSHFDQTVFKKKWFESGERSHLRQTKKNNKFKQNRRVWFQFHLNTPPSYVTKTSLHCKRRVVPV